MAFKQHINIPGVLVLGLVSGMVLIVMILATQALYGYSEQNEIDLKTAWGAKSDLVRQKEQQAQSLQQLAWTDDKKNAVMIPIDQAMEIMVKTQGKLPSTRP